MRSGAHRQNNRKLKIKVVLLQTLPLSHPFVCYCNLELRVCKDNCNKPTQKVGQHLIYLKVGLICLQGEQSKTLRLP